MKGLTKRKKKQEPPERGNTSLPMKNTNRRVG